MLEVDGLTVSYGPIRAVHGISFRVKPGQLVSLLGANGAGKSTTLAAISGLLRPATGQIRWQHRSLVGCSPAQIVDRGIVQVPEGRAILAQMTVLENLELGGFRRRDRAELSRDIDAMLERFPILGERRNSLAGTLSGGEQQMLAIARGLVARPELLLLDEPSMGLAPQLVQRIFQIVTEIRAEGRTVLLVEQNARKALAIADYVYVLQNGRIVAEGHGADLLQQDVVVGAYLGGTVTNFTPATSSGTAPPQGEPNETR